MVFSQNSSISWHIQSHFVLGYVIELSLYAVRANNVQFDFSVVDFPIMNLHDLIVVAMIMNNVNVLKLQVTSKEDFLIGFAHLKNFIDGYYGALSLTDIE